MSLIWNSIISLIYGMLGGFWAISYTAFSTIGIHIVDWKHFPNVNIYLYNYVSTANQFYAEDIQLDVKYTRNENGAILGYLDSNGFIDVTNYVAHVTLEGTIIIWGRDDDPYGIFCVVIPFNCILAGVYNGNYLSVEASSNTAWQPTDVPNHWFITSPTISIEVKYNRNDNYPYVDTTYLDHTASRYDDKRREPTAMVRTGEISPYIISSGRINSYEFNKQLDKAMLYISWLKYKYETYPLTLGNFRKSAVS